MYSDFKLAANPDGTYDIILRVGDDDAEFARELLQKGGDEIRGLYEAVSKFAAKKAKNKKLNAVRIMAGGLLIATIPAAFVLNAEAADAVFSMGYIHTGTAEQQIGYVAQTQNNITTVSPSYFNLTDSGALSLNYVSSSFVASMRAKNIRVVPFLSNHWNKTQGTNALKNADALASSIVNSIKSYNLDGVHVDIENVSHTERDAYTQFVALLRQRVPAGKEVSVAVAANPKGYTTGWHGSYDYAGLAKSADYLMIMAYDEHYEGGSAGPVASIGFVRDSINYALKHVSADKLVLGVPFFGRLWGPSLKGTGITMARAEELARTMNATVTYDTTAEAVKAVFTVTNENVTVNGTKLSAGRYEMWYENDQSIKAKLGLINEYGLKGAASWALGQAPGALWDTYGSWYSSASGGSGNTGGSASNGSVFADISGHWARQYIESVNTEGLMTGTGNGLFSPESGLTRAQAATLACRMLGLDTSSGYNAGLNDTSGHWAERAINTAVANGAFKGYPDGSFKPEKVMSREEMAVMFSRILGLSPSENSSGFSDIEPGRWSASEIDALARAGIITGFSNNTFRPERTLTRAETAAMLDRT